jgi:hypothetical protein
MVVKQWWTQRMGIARADSLMVRSDLEKGRVRRAWGRGLGGCTWSVGGACGLWEGGVWRKCIVVGAFVDNISAAAVRSRTMVRTELWSGSHAVRSTVQVSARTGPRYGSWFWASLNGSTLVRTFPNRSETAAKREHLRCWGRIYGRLFIENS